MPWSRRRNLSGASSDPQLSRRTVVQASISRDSSICHNSTEESCWTFGGNIGSSANAPARSARATICAVARPTTSASRASDSCRAAVSRMPTLLKLPQQRWIERLHAFLLGELESKCDIAAAQSVRCTPASCDWCLLRPRVRPVGRASEREDPKAVWTWSSSLRRTSVPCSQTLDRAARLRSVVVDALVVRPG